MKKQATINHNTPKIHVSTLKNKINSAVPAGGNSAAASRPMLRQDDLNSLKEAASTVHQIMLNAQRELETAKKMRDEARKYQQESAARARSDAQQLVLRARLATQRETEELIRQSSEEIQKELADIRMIRIMAQEELAAQRKFTDAARLHTMSLALHERGDEPDDKEKAPLISII